MKNNRGIEEHKFVQGIDGEISSDASRADIVEAEMPVTQTKNDNQLGGGAGHNSAQPNHYGSTYRPQSALVSPTSSSKIPEKKTYRNAMWESIASNIMQESKRTGTMPSIENFSQRLNLFRKKIEKPDVIEIILQNKDQLLKQIKKEEERKAKIQNRIHETIEAKLRKEQGDVKYYSKLKKNQFDSRMQKEEARVRQNRQTSNQQQGGEKSVEKKNAQNQGLTQQQNQQPGNFNSPQQQKSILQHTGSLQVIGGQQVQQIRNDKIGGIQNNQNLIQTQSTTRLGSQQNANNSFNNMSLMGLQQPNNLPNQKNTKSIRFQTPPMQQQQQQYQSPQPSQYQRQELENRIMNSNNPIIKDNLALTIKQIESQKQSKQFKARPVPGVFERLSQDQVKKNQQTEVEIDIPLDIEFKTAKGEQLYREIRKKDDEEEIKRHVIRFLLEHRQKAEDEFKLKPSLLSQGQKYYSEESKEFSLLSPNFLAKKKMQEMIEKGTLTDDFFEHRANLEEGNVYLLTKVSKILKGNIMKKWKSIQDSKF